MVDKLTNSSVKTLNVKGETARNDAEPLEFADFSACLQERSRASGTSKPAQRPEVADQIGVSLRTVYNDVLSQPVPDRFFDLLRQLETSCAPLKKDAS